MPYVTGVLAGSAVTLALLWRDVRDDPRRLVGLVLALGVAGALGAKLYSVVERGGVVWHDVGFELRSGYRYPGGILAVVASLPFLWRILRPAISIGRYLDAVAIGTCAAMVATRMGCYLSGCCHGTISDLPWATRYPAGTAPWYDHRAVGLIPESSAWSAYGHPLQLYFLFAFVVIGAILVRRRSRGPRFEGELALMFLVLDGLSKGALESLRFDYHASLQVSSLVIAAVGAVAWIFARRRTTGEVPDSWSAHT